MIFNNKKQGQMTIQFNWIFVLGAGTVILIFFVGIIVKQQAISERNLSYEIVNILQSIITGSTVSEQTKNFIDSSSLKNYVLEFNCESEGGGFRDIFSGYGIKGSGASVETPIEAIFSPKEIQSNQIIAWSMPFKFPFKVMDVLMLTSLSTKYYFIGSSDPTFLTELENSTEGLNVDFIDSFEEVNAVGNYHVKIVDFDSGVQGSQITNNGPVPENLKLLQDSQVSSVSFMGTGGVNFYEKSGTVFKKVNGAEVQLVSIKPEERDVSKYGIIFSSGEDAYKCNMMKVFKRLEIITKTYEHKYEELRTYYDPSSLSYWDHENPACYAILESDDLINAFSGLLSSSQGCSYGGYGACEEMFTYALTIKDKNEKLDEAGCIKLY